MEPTQGYLKQLLDYNSKTGVFTWKSKKHGRMKSGDIAGSLDTHGYRQIKISQLPTGYKPVACRRSTKVD